MRKAQANGRQTLVTGWVDMNRGNFFCAPVQKEIEKFFSFEIDGLAKRVIPTRIWQTTSDRDKACFTL